MRRRRLPHSSMFAVLLAGSLFFVLWKRHAIEDRVQALRNGASYLSLGDEGRVRVRLTGTENPGVPVILEAGVGGTSAEWGWLQRDLARDHPVLSYDRRGVGLSDEAPAGANALTYLADLEGLLEKSGLPPPYLLVGHSYGAVLVRLYQNLHPEKVAGLFLIEPSHPDEETRLPRASLEAAQEFYRKVRRSAHYASFGFARFSGLRALSAGLPAPEREEMATLESFDRHLLGVVAEAEGMSDGFARVRVLPPAENLPVGVASATVPRDERLVKTLELHDEIARGSRRGFHALIEGARRDALLNHQAYVSQIAADIRTLETMVAPAL